MERKIGERFYFKGEMFEVVEAEAEGCVGCYFNHQDCSLLRNTRGACGARTDAKTVIFKKADKSVVLLIKAHEEFVRCGIESEIVQEIEEYLNKPK